MLFIIAFICICTISKLHSLRSSESLRSRFKTYTKLYPKALRSYSSEEPFISYNPLKIESYYDKRPLDVWQRLVEVGSPILGWWIVRKYENITSSFRSLEENYQLLNLRATDLKDSIIQGKSITLIKSGQALALRPDIVKSPEYVRELQKLQDEVGTFDNSLAKEIIETELGKPLDDLFDFEPKIPIASASIGQVYKGTLRDTGQRIAVKVQRPDALFTASIDMYILRKLAAYIKKQKKLRSDLVEIVDEFGRQLFCELNYRQEASNCRRFKELYGNIQGIYVPDVYENYTSQRVLTMEWVDGVKGPWATGGERMLTIGLQCSVKQLLDTGFFHADPHRGNLLQTPDGRLAYLDFGMMAEVTGSKRFGLIGTVLGLVNKDIGMVVRNLRDLDFFPPDLDTEVVIQALNSAVMNSTINGQGSTLNFTRLGANIERISYLLPVKLPPFYTLIIRTLTILEGLALFVDPDFRLIRGAYPFIAKQVLVSPSQELGELLRAVIVTKDGRIRWDKLEQFISISANADAAVQGDFSALKRAQKRSDVSKIYSGAEEDVNVTIDVASQILDYLVSENGRILREPLVLEMVDTIDSLGLTLASIGSVLTNGILPKPSVPPDRARVEQFLTLLQLVVNRLLGSKATEGLATDSMANVENLLAGNWTNVVNAGTFESINVVLSTLLEAARETASPSTIAKLQPILTRLAPIASDVLAGVLERGTRRAIRRILSPKNIQNRLPLVGGAVDFLAYVSSLSKRSGLVSSES